MAIVTYTKAGVKAATAVKLDKAVFGVTVNNHALLQHAYVSYLANGRGSDAVTKTRGQVRGGGKKPWRQKGTGRARFGSSRNPIWRGGGIAFGPTGVENHSKQINLKAKRLAIRQALSLAVQHNKVVIVQSIESRDGKTANFAKLLEKVGATKKTLIVVDVKEDLLIRATSNLARVKVVQATYLNVFDILNADHLLISKNSLDAIHSWLGETA